MTALAKIVWTRNALNDLERIRHYLLEQADPEIMQSEVVRIWIATLRLKRFPASGRPGRVPDTRELIVPPYILPYRILEERVEILDVFHHARNWGE